MTEDALCRFPVGPRDLRPLLDLLDLAILHHDPDQAALLYEIGIDLRGLPAKEPRQFELNIENQAFGNSQWASLSSWDGYSLEFGTGSHVYDPGVGGDSSSETIYECSAEGEARGDLSNWLHAIEMLDHSNIAVTASSDEIEPEEQAEEKGESPEDYRSRVRIDHYFQKFACIAVAVYGWQLAGIALMISGILLK